MLVLSRKRGEKIVIELGGGKCVDITVLNISGSRVKLGFAGPTEAWIHRSEVKNESQSEVSQATAE